MLSESSQMMSTSAKYQYQSIVFQYSFLHFSFQRLEEGEDMQNFLAVLGFSVRVLIELSNYDIRT